MGRRKAPLFYFMSNFKQRERYTLLLLNEKGFKLEGTGGKYDHYDLYGQTPKGRNVIIEVKERFDEYDEWVMEKYKADKMLKAKADTDTLLLYICVYQDTTYIYDVEDIINLNVTHTFRMPEASEEEFEKYGDYIDKLCYLFPRETFKAKLLNYEKKRNKL